MSSINSGDGEKFSIDKLTWVLGDWVHGGGLIKSTETWIKVNDDLFDGSSETINNGKITFREKLKIIRQADGIFYVADVKHNPAPVSFKLISQSDDVSVFENRQHDFPQTITYKNENGTLHAWIEGTGKDSQWKKIDFFMNKKS